MVQRRGRTNPLSLAIKRSIIGAISRLGESGSLSPVSDAWIRA
jgi:hypothetical protein